jgi:hypothetical protein
MFTSLQSPRNSIDLVARPQEQTHAPAAAEPCSVGGDWPDILRTSLALHDDRSTEGQHPPNAVLDNLRSPPSPDSGCEHIIRAQGPGQAGDNILRAASGLQAPNRESTTKRQDNSFAGPFGFSEEALVRLEAGLRAQREHLLARPAQLAAAPGICPIDGDEAYQAPDRVSLPPTRAAFRSPDTTQRLPLAAQLHPLPEFSVAYNELHVQTPDKRAPERLASSSSITDHRRNWHVPLIILISTIIAILIGGTFPAAERISVNAEVIEPARIKTISPELPSTAPENNHVNNQFSNDLAPSSQIGLEFQPTTSISPEASIQPAAPIQASADPVIANQSKMPSTIMLPSGGDMSSPRSNRGRRAARAQRLQARLPSPG